MCRSQHRSSHFGRSRGPPHRTLAQYRRRAPSNSLGPRPPGNPALLPRKIRACKRAMHPDRPAARGSAPPHSRNMRAEGRERWDGREHRNGARCNGRLLWSHSTGPTQGNAMGGPGKSNRRSQGLADRRHPTSCRHPQGRSAQLRRKRSGPRAKRGLRIASGDDASAPLTRPPLSGGKKALREQRAKRSDQPSAPKQASS